MQYKGRGMWLLRREAETLVEYIIPVTFERKVYENMSADGNDSGAIWQGPINSDQSHLIKQVPLPAQDELPPLVPQFQASALPPEASPATNSQEDANEQTGSLPAPLELAKQLWQYFTLILAPLLFGALTCLFVLPLVATGRASAPPEALWLVTFIIIAVTIMQGIAVYYAGENNGFWALATVGGFFIFLLIGGFTIFGLVAGFILLVLILAAIIFLARFYVHPVPEGFVDIVYAFGRYSRTLYPGFNILLPWEKTVKQLNVEETQWISPAQRVQLSRNEDVILRGIVSYQLMPEDAHLAVTQVQNWEEGLRELFLTCIQSIATTFTPDDFIVWPQGLQVRPSLSRGSSMGSDGGIRWERINDYLYQQMRDKVALWGVMIHKVQIRDVSLAPHGTTIIDTDPIGNMSNAVENAVARHTTPPDARKAETGAPPTTESVQPVQLAQTTSVQAPAPGTPPRAIKEEVLITAYREVQNGKITDPQTIREIAAQFEAVARDPQANQHVTFDAERAAYNLYEQAKVCEAEARNKAQAHPQEAARPHQEREGHFVNEGNLSPGGWVHDKG